VFSYRHGGPSALRRARRRADGLLLHGTRAARRPGAMRRPTNEVRAALRDRGTAAVRRRRSRICFWKRSSREGGRAGRFQPRLSSSSTPSSTSFRAPRGEVWLAAVGAAHSTYPDRPWRAPVALQLHNPIRAAEMAATLDIIDRGRLDFAPAARRRPYELRLRHRPRHHPPVGRGAPHVPKMWRRRSSPGTRPPSRCRRGNVLPKR